ncbi:hypothetical protein KL929_001610 [Ogataea haglerorum]|uniref:uncharacterized protein n=1 Tax=Ogataea haglerorum TaxID=1937702 RepID=UPI001C8AA6FE|nr:uncharacterized protein KL911_000299 [Ogataea haglerorum]KAG7748356.1 hypothetical protein KL912_002261 [Ogataea haglerorum]KAG7759162.1 hypothetical protein KL911_000299 [Ogataea haglerorum]KAG7791659.1 hypothetical protein KL910_001785 [Ogataea haglerorum]KAG7792404.1 hypothetical protein KL945_000685 [Ogataea haglerorum]KAG7798567.1 hypothetical protein KL929_001610 [Ogataea haglerorum]
MVEVRIPSTTVLNDYHLYNIEIQFGPGVHVHKLSKRFSDFVEFKKELEDSLHATIPYSLPSKFTALYQSRATTIEQRRVGLAEFLNGLLNDEQLRRHKLVGEFLYLPENTFNQEKEEVSLSQIEWLEVSKEVKALLHSVRTKIFAKQANVFECKRILDACEAKIDQLNKNVHNDELGAGEVRRRKAIVDQQRHECNELRALSRGVTAAVEKPTFKRSLGKAKETEATKPLDNEQLYRQQQLLMIRSKR